jgi:hypothetical protein
MEPEAEAERLTPGDCVYEMPIDVMSFDGADPPAIRRGQ